MDEKRALEAFRVQQFGRPHPAAAALPARQDICHQDSNTSSIPSDDPYALDLVPGFERIVVHFDVDCFYAQVEEVHNPNLRGKPLAVTQKYLVVTANYAARGRGVTKLMGIQDALRACPELLLVPGEDLSPYRAASKSIRAVLSRWGPTEKLGLDEAWVDVTQEVSSRLAASSSSSSSSGDDAPVWCGHLVAPGTALTSDSKHRPQDLRVQMPTGTAVRQKTSPNTSSAIDNSNCVSSSHACCRSSAASPAGYTAAAGAGAGAADTGLLRLQMGSVIAAEMRAAVAAETGYRCSAGVSVNKLLSKLVSGLHKPDQQTVITPHNARAFLAPLPVRCLPGVGFKTEALLKSAHGVTSVLEVRQQLSRQSLAHTLGDRPAAALFAAVRGVDLSPVVASGAPKSITVEDSFKGCSSWQGVTAVLQVLAPDLLTRLAEDREEFGSSRTPVTFTVKWRRAGTGWQRSSASAPWPLQHTQQQHGTTGGSSGGGSNNDQVAAVTAVVAAALKLLKQQLQPPFCLTLLNIGVTGFKEPSTTATAGGGGIQRFFSKAAATELPTELLPAAAAGQGGVAAERPAAGALLMAAKASTTARRDYNKALSSRSSTPYLGAGEVGRGSGIHSPVLLSKRQERQLWELGMQQQQQQYMQQVPAKRVCFGHEQYAAGVALPEPVANDGNALADIGSHSGSAAGTNAATASEAVEALNTAAGFGHGNTTAANAAPASSNGSHGGAARCGISSFTLHDLEDLGMLSCEVLEVYEQCSADDDEDVGQCVEDDVLALEVLGGREAD